MYNNPAPNLPDLNLPLGNFSDALIFRPRPKAGGAVLVPPNPSSMKFLAADQLIYTGDPLEQFHFFRKKASMHPSLT